MRRHPQLIYISLYSWWITNPEKYKPQMPQTMHTITPLITSQLNHKLNFYKRKQGKLDQEWKKKRLSQINPILPSFLSIFFVFLILHFTKKPNSVYSNLKKAQNLFSVAASASFCFFQSPLFFLSLSFCHPFSLFIVFLFSSHFLSLLLQRVWQKFNGFFLKTPLIICKNEFINHTW